MLMIARSVFPELVRVMVLAALVVPTGWPPNSRLGDETVAVPLVPAPFNCTNCGLLKSESENVTVATRAPAALGVKVIVTLQLSPACRVEKQPLVTAKSVELAVTPEMFSVEVP